MQQYTKTNRDANRRFWSRDDVTLKKRGLNVNSDSFITMVIRHSMTPPSTSDAF